MVAAFGIWLVTWLVLDMRKRRGRAPLRLEEALAAHAADDAA